MRPTANDLALRDSALAALVGGMPADFGNDFGGGFGDETPNAANMALAFNEKMATRARERILRPNQDSSTKVQRYCFAINQTLTVGTAVALAMTGNPETEFRPQRITANVPAVGFATYSSMKVANVGILVGGVVDAYDFSAVGVGQSLDVPTLSPANAAKVNGNYTGTVPLPLVLGDSFVHSISFKGPANLAG